MAGDWIKMRGNLWDDPRVGAVCDATEQGEAAIVGGLFWLWSTADQHTEDGFMAGLTLRQIDRKTGIQGFGKALCVIGWISEAEGGIQIAKFDDHNGASAKRRSMDAQRKANSRKTSGPDADKTDDVSATDADSLRRISELEKELEEEKKKNQCTHTPLAEGWKLPKPWGEWAIAEFPHWTAEVVRSIADQFADHWRASAGSSADWQATWQKWCRDDLTQRAHPKPREAAQPRASPAITVAESSLKAITEAMKAADAAHAAKLADPEEKARVAAAIETARQRMAQRKAA